MLLTACVGASAEVYEGSSIGMQGTVTVAMTVEDGVIKNVELTECHETANIAGVAMERLPQLMVEHQTTTLDAVTGATLASNAIMRAAANAAKAAGLDADALKANAYSEPAGRMRFGMPTCWLSAAAEPVCPRRSLRRRAAQRSFWLKKALSWAATP